MFDFSQIISFDKQLFLALNGLHLDWLDPVMAYISSEMGWIPLYLVVAFFLVKTYGRESIWFFVVVALIFLLTDQLSAHFFKPFFHRFRPCHDAEIGDLVYLPYGHCGGKYGFVSSHACNVFGFAVFVAKTLKSSWRHWPVLIYSWALLVCYSRIYMGVHFPLDIICGALVGAGLSLFFLFILKKIKGNVFLNKKNV